MARLSTVGLAFELKHLNKHLEGWDRYGLQFDFPIGYRIVGDGSRTPLTYGEIKIKDGFYHVIPRSGPG